VDIQLKNASNGVDVDVKPIKSRLTNRETLLSDLGIEARPLNEAERKKLKVKNGVMITTIKANSIIAKTNMEKNFIITAANQKNVSTIDELLDIVMAASGEVVLDGFYENYSGDYSYVFEK
jgi:S1-C subfamily serine protease